MNIYIFKIGKDGFLYPVINGIEKPSFLTKQELCNWLKQYHTFESGITEEEFDKNYKILTDIYE